MKAVRIIVLGKVQGVFFRASAKAKASSLGLSGLVRNLGDGSVEIIAQGKSKAVDELVQWARKGPSAARVDSVRVNDLEHAQEHKGFVIAPDG